MSGMMIFKYLSFLGIKCREPVRVAQIGAVLLPMLNRMEQGVKLWRSSAFDQMCCEAPDWFVLIFQCGISHLQNEVTNGWVSDLFKGVAASVCQGTEDKAVVVCQCRCWVFEIMDVVFDDYVG